MTMKNTTKPFGEIFLEEETHFKTSMEGELELVVTQRRFILWAKWAAARG